MSQSCNEFLIELWKRLTSDLSAKEESRKLGSRVSGLSDWQHRASESMLTISGKNQVTLAVRN